MKSDGLTSQVFDVTYYDGFNSKTFTNGVEYRQDMTPIVNTVNPRFGDIAGGYTLTLNGVNLNVGSPVVVIDGIDCPFKSGNSTQIVCTVGARSTTPTVDNNFVVKIGGKNVILRDSFLYILRWSDTKTWGVDLPPVDGDLVVVPLGTTLMVDQDTPKLKGIAVDGGRIIFSDETDLTIKTGFITVNKGEFIAGT